jgi:hypothetical protein
MAATGKALGRSVFGVGAIAAVAQQEAHGGQCALLEGSSSDGV